MKRIKNDSVILVLYSIGINFYFFLWFLGSERYALHWSFHALNFFIVWLGANVASIGVFVGFILFRWRDNKSPQLPFKSNRLALLAQWALGVFFFMTFFSLFIAVYVS
ncbi:MAG: hypothetical protein AAF519_04535, partial [Bacteroidota bacterium]